ncbi:ligand-binding sensor domain-containing protein [Mucilaginibacter sp. McL0603]|uniref:ligand-binding sensor domain-containing protein n=1 Tax=Mucilaginibacter sp. McL0603 TaxID=3415670 RepID=UPI003CEA4BE1
MPDKTFIFFAKGLATACLLLWTTVLCAQKYNFQHYDLGSGLSQSQVLAICQDKQKQIWLSNFGGINSFDGKKFNSYSIEDGLVSNSNFTIASDNDGNIWWGSNKGLTAFTNNGMHHYKFKDSINVRSITRVICDRNNIIWSLAKSKLYKLIHGKLVEQLVTSQKEMISNIEVDHNGSLYAAIYQSGIYKLDKARWKIVLNTSDAYVKDFTFNDKSPGTIFFISDLGLYQSDSISIKKISAPSLYSEASELTTINFDHHQNLWIGTNKGSFMLKGNLSRYFNENNGFSNNRILSSYCDADNRMWFGTDGGGLYSYDNDDFMIYDKSQGLNNEIVMSMAKDSNGQIYWGTNGGGLWSFVNNKIKQEAIYGKESAKLRINCLLNDRNDNLWVGTDNMGLWVKHRVAGKMVYSPVSVGKYLFFNLAEGANNIVWAATSNGCFYIEDRKLMRVESIHHFCSSVLVKGPDSVFVGSVSGIELIRNKKLDSNFKLGKLAGKNVITLYAYGPYVLIGTNDYGLFVWNTKTNDIKNLNVKNGLQSNTVYSIDIVGNALWLGTGKGISKFKIIDPGRMDLKSESIFNPIVETNQNSILHTDSDVWIGTTHGVYVYKTNRDAKVPAVPNTVIQSVWLSAKNKVNVNYTYQHGYHLPVNLTLPSDKSQIEIEFQAIDFSGATDIQYQYQLEGLDKTYGKLVTGDYVDYPSLPPGKYTFKVRSVNSAGLFTEPAVFSFTITPTFFQSIIFKILVILVFLSAGYSIYRYKIYQNNRKALYIEALRLEEQASVRRQTAEDFHDDLGNKLTRINLLSELLDKKIGKNKADEKLLIQQIRSSVAELYSGTKNILWALNPDNDNLYEIYDLIIRFGQDLFAGSGISFKVSANDPEFKRLRLPLGSGRNIILIAKELLHNILQHAGAKTVTLSLVITSNNKISMTISDDGCGFECEQISTGNGLRNMQNRAKRLNGTLDIKSIVNTGTTSQVSFPIPG